MLLTIGNALTRQAMRDPDRVAVLVDERKITFAELDHNANVVANALSRRGVGRGDFVAVVTRNRLEHVFLYYATARLGAILAPINFWLRDDEIRWTLEQVRPRVLVMAAEWDRLLEARDALSADHVFVLDTDETSAPDTEPWTSLLADPDATLPDIEVGERDVHIVYWTSGTTGASKGVLKTQRGHTLNAYQYALALGLNEDDRGLCAFPLFNVGGYESTFAKYVHLGGSAVMLPKFDAGEVLAAIERHSITTLLANPTHFRLLLDHPALATTDLSSLRQVEIGGMVVAESLLCDIAERLGVGLEGLFHIYGQTEGPPLIATLRGVDALRKLGSIGKAVPGVDLRLMDDDGTLLPRGSTGEIVVPAGNVMDGYLNNPETTAETIGDGWLHTGDLARQDDEGYLYIVGRKKDIIRSGGQSVFPSDIETCLGDHPAVKDIAVIGTPDPTGKWGEIVTAVIVLDPSQPRPDEEQLKAFAERIRVITTSAGPPDVVRPLIEGSGLIHMHKVGDTRQALRAQSDGVDVILASGYEAGGHTHAQPVHTFILGPNIVQAVDLPVVLAGGIRDGATLAAALALGTDAVAMGTRFVASHDNPDWHPAYAERILEAHEGDDIVFEAIYGPSRALHTRGVDDLAEVMATQSMDVHELTAWKDVRLIGAQRDGKLEEGLMPCGQVASAITDLIHVAEFVPGIVQDAIAVLEGLRSSVVVAAVERATR